MIKLLYILIFSLIANSFALVDMWPISLAVIIPMFLFANVFAGVFSLKTDSRRMKICYHGGVLLCAFSGSVIISAIYHIVLSFLTIPDNYMLLIWSMVFCFLTELILFWNGIICVYCTSVQLGIRIRVMGALCGMIPIANLIALKKIVSTVMTEIKTEMEKKALNRQRKADEICRTRYPILLVHGVFFRDTEYLNYWGRIPGELEANGAIIYYGNHQSALSVADSAAELTERIKEIVEETGCEKVNIIAHSKGGLDCRYAISKLDAAPYVASLTTINTPHRGCLFADYLLGKISENIKNSVADTYNSTLKKLGEVRSDFLAAVKDLTAEACTAMDEELSAPEGIFCQSIGSKLNKAASGKFPLNFSYHLVKYFDGANDGLVSESSFQWGENYKLITTEGKRGISHGDMIDLNRENIKDFDVREFYVELVKNLKAKNL